VAAFQCDSIRKPIRPNSLARLRFQENGRDSLGPLTAVLTMLFCVLDQRAIAMERAAAGAGHRLVDMTSEEGDWFLEELCGLFGKSAIVFFWRMRTAEAMS